ncbi:small nuclear ribonucleoprotein-associated protein B-like [Hylaeus volcanicus]|uniref:small nuclear ribonucleoprotein-associated protein B-like n=1 Tax=Hylaeus volcanicus TaxID=313075 RepID=UPI0023B88133|nr:small nuclear ribonucleoprotein-associated protein B-like [Hylaeus volcanicus]
MGKNTRMQQWINYRIRVTVDDARMFVGTFMAFDRHMNVVLADTEEFRRVKVKGQSTEKEIKRSIGFLLIRGESIISITAEAPPAPQTRRPDVNMAAGRGIVPVGMGRGAPMLPVLGNTPIGLEGPVRGVGGIPQF